VTKQFYARRIKEPVYFPDEQHQRNYEYLGNLYPLSKRDHMYKTAIYLIAYPEIFNKINQYLDKENPISWAIDLLEKEISIDFSRGYIHLIELMLNLWNGYERFNLYHAISTWDDEVYNLFLQAIKLSRF